MGKLRNLVIIGLDTLLGVFVGHTTAQSDFNDLPEAVQIEIKYMKEIDKLKDTHGLKLENWDSVCGSNAPSEKCYVLSKSKLGSTKKG